MNTRSNMIKLSRHQVNDIINEELEHAGLIILGERRGELSSVQTRSNPDPDPDDDGGGGGGATEVTLAPMPDGWEDDGSKTVSVGDIFTGKKSEWQFIVTDMGDGTLNNIEVTVHKYAPWPELEGVKELTMSDVADDHELKKHIKAALDWAESQGVEGEGEGEGEVETVEERKLEKAERFPSNVRDGDEIYEKKTEGGEPVPVERKKWTFITKSTIIVNNRNLSDWLDDNIEGLRPDDVVKGVTVYFKDKHAFEKAYSLDDNNTEFIKFRIVRGGIFRGAPDYPKSGPSIQSTKLMKRMVWGD